MRDKRQGSGAWVRTSKKVSKIGYKQWQTNVEHPYFIGLQASSTNTSMSRPKPQEEQTKQKHHDDIEAAGAISIPIPPPSCGTLHHHGDDPFHRRNTNKQHDALSAASVEKSSSNILETDLSTSSKTEIPRGHSILPVTSSGGGAPGTSSRQSSMSSPHSNTMKTMPPEPKLIHPLLKKIPLHIRFGINGLLTNILVRRNRRNLPRFFLPRSHHFAS